MFLNNLKSHVAFLPPQGTTNQVRLPDGSRLIIQMSETRTVGDLRQYVQMARRVYVDQPISLRLSHPPKELDNDGATLKDAGVLNAAILLRLKWKKKLTL